MIEITEEHIDAAVKMLDNVMGVAPYYPWDVLNELGIKRCFECNATGIYIDPGRIDRVNCPLCDGHGWVHNAE